MCGNVLLSFLQNWRVSVENAYQKISGLSCVTDSESAADQRAFKWLIFKNGSFMAHFAALCNRLQMAPLWRWKICKSADNGTMDQTQNVHSRISGTVMAEPFIHISRNSSNNCPPAASFKTQNASCVPAPPFPTRSGLFWGHAFGAVPYFKNDLKPFHQVKQTRRTSLSVASQLSQWIAEQVSKCQASSVLLLPLRLPSVISTCGRCQRDQRARAKHGSVRLHNDSVLHFSGRDFCSIEALSQTLRQCQRCAGTEGRGRRGIKVGLSVLTASRATFPQLPSKGKKVWSIKSFFCEFESNASTGEMF